MKIGGPKGIGPSNPPLNKEVTDAKISKTKSSTFEEVLKPSSTSTKPQVQPPSSIISEITSKLRAGVSSPHEVANMLIEATLQSKSSLPNEVKERLRETLHKLLADDPTLAAKINILTREDDNLE
jgi:DNA repair exonuclease SbcCD nuclease subunit